MAASQTVIEIADSVLDVDFAAWRQNGIRIVGLDVDGTITTHNGVIIEQAVIDYINAASKEGMRFVLFTNNMFGKRLIGMQSRFEPSVIEAIYNPRYFFDRKPRRVMVRRMIKDLGLDPQQIGIVGNTYTADVWSAVRAKVARVAWVKGYAKRNIFDIVLGGTLQRRHRQAPRG